MAMNQAELASTNRENISAQSLANSLFQKFALECHKNGIQVYAGKADAVRADCLRMAQRVIRQSTAEGMRG